MHDLSDSKSLGPYITVSYVCVCVRTVCDQGASTYGTSMSSSLVSRNYPNKSGIDVSAFVGLAVITGHALVDTGAQSGVIGLHYWQRWVAALAYFGLQPLFQPVHPNMSAGGIGGGQDIVAVCTMPMGVAGAHGFMEWAVVEDPSPDDWTPALLPNPYLIQVDAAIEPKHK